MKCLTYNIRVFHSLYKVGRYGIIVFKGFNNSKKSGDQANVRDYYWFNVPLCYIPT